MLLRQSFFFSPSQLGSAFALLSKWKKMTTSTKWGDLASDFNWAWFQGGGDPPRPPLLQQSQSWSAPGLCLVLCWCRSSQSPSQWWTVREQHCWRRNQGSRWWSQRILRQHLSLSPAEEKIHSWLRELWTKFSSLDLRKSYICFRSSDVVAPSGFAFRLLGRRDTNKGSPSAFATIGTWTQCQLTTR